jgi:hypothetical protein
MNASLVNRLEDLQLITPKQAKALRVESLHLSVGKDLRFWLYVGILLMTSGISIWVYDHIDSLGHQVVISAIALLCAGCLGFCFRKGGGFQFKPIQVGDWTVDYLLLAGSLLLVFLIGYLQFQYQVFGTAYDLASFVPMILLFLLAYYFDHKGVLAMAITNLIVWVGITATPTRFWMDASFFETPTAHAAMLLGVALWGWAYMHERISLKPHFAFSYQNVGMHLFLLGAAVAMVNRQNSYGWYLIPALLGCAFLYWWATERKSFYMIVVAVLYAYFFLSYAIIRVLLTFDVGGALFQLYLMGTAIMLLVFLLKAYRQMKKS